MSTTAKSAIKTKALYVMDHLMAKTEQNITLYKILDGLSNEPPGIKFRFEVAWPFLLKAD